MTLPRSSFGLYLYLCGNQNGYELSLSSVAIQQALGVSDSSYRRAVEDLLAAGYLMMRNDKKNTMDFYTSPQPTDYVKKDYNKKKSTTGGGAASAEPVSIYEASYEPDSYEAYLKEYYASSPGKWRP